MVMDPVPASHALRTSETKKAAPGFPEPLTHLFQHAQLLPWIVRRVNTKLQGCIAFIQIPDEKIAVH